MDGARNFSTQDVTQSLANWWALAGVSEIAGEEPRSWFDVEPEAAVTEKPEQPERAAPKEELVSSVGVPLADWPADIEALRTQISSGALLPGNMFGGKSVVPTGKPGAKLMVISDMPDADECATGEIGRGASGRLLTAMLAAIGISMDEIYWTPLATTMFAAGELPDTALPPLAEFALHQLQLVEPQAVMLLGSSASKALLGEELMKARGNLRDINYDVRKKAALTTFHPRTLIARPAMKAQAWQDLQMLAKGGIL